MSLESQSGRKISNDPPSRLQKLLVTGLMHVLDRVGAFGVLDGFRIGGSKELFANAHKSFTRYNSIWDTDVRGIPLVFVPKDFGGYIGVKEQGKLFGQRCRVEKSNQTYQVFYDPNSTHFDLYISTPDVTKGQRLGHNEAIMVSINHKGNYIPAYLMVGRDKKIDPNDQRSTMKVFQIEFDANRDFTTKDC